MSNHYDEVCSTVIFDGHGMRLTREQEEMARGMATAEVHGQYHKVLREINIKIIALLPKYYALVANRVKQQCGISANEGEQ